MLQSCAVFLVLRKQMLKFEKINVEIEGAVLYIYLGKVRKCLADRENGQF